MGSCSTFICVTVALFAVAHGAPRPGARRPRPTECPQWRNNIQWMNGGKGFLGTTGKQTAGACQKACQTKVDYANRPCIGWSYWAGSGPWHSEGTWCYLFSNEDLGYQTLESTAYSSPGAVSGLPMDCDSEAAALYIPAMVAPVAPLTVAPANAAPVTVAPGNPDNCPDKWVDAKSVNMGCLHFDSPKLTWIEASRHCMAENGYLVEILNVSQQEFVRVLTTAIETGSGQVMDWWIGATDINHEGNWFWSHSEMSVNFTSWAANQPNGGDWQNFAILEGTSFYEWVDVQEEHICHAICQLNA